MLAFKTLPGDFIYLFIYFKRQMVSFYVRIIFKRSFVYTLLVHQFQKGFMF